MTNKFIIQPNDQQWVGKTLRRSNSSPNFKFRVTYVGDDIIVGINEHGREDSFPRVSVGVYWELYKEPFPFKVGDFVRKDSWIDNGYYKVDYISESYICFYLYRGGQRIKPIVRENDGTFTKENGWGIYFPDPSDSRYFLAPMLRKDEIKKGDFVKNKHGDVYFCYLNSCEEIDRSYFVKLGKKSGIAPVSFESSTLQALEFKKLQEEELVTLNFHFCVSAPSVQVPRENSIKWSHVVALYS